MKVIIVLKHSIPGVHYSAKNISQLAGKIRVKLKVFQPYLFWQACKLYKIMQK